MTKAEAKKRIAKLRKVIEHHRYLYHVLDKPEVSDAAFDSLKHELYKLEKQYPDLITPDSPTQRVGGKPLDKFRKVRHLKPMLSLEDVFNEKELTAWQERIGKLVPEKKLDYFAELKIDGFAISLIYQDGVFIEGSTRGDGRIGEDVTQNLKTIESIPLRLRESKKVKTQDRVEIRGEVYMTNKAFEKINREQKKKGLAPYANPRNTAAGSIRQLDPKIAAARDLNFLAYDLVTDLGQKTHQEEHQICKELGFKTDEGKYCRNLKEVVNFWQNIGKKREKLPYQIDGVVINVNDDKTFQQLGVVGKAPRGAIALKFPAKQVTTVVEDIKVQVGRTGALTPVAHLKPVSIGGTTVTRATLHNEDEIKKLGVKIGDTVIIQRAGDVIPDVVKTLKDLRDGKEKEFRMPSKCPICQSKVVRPKGEAITRCPNKKCAARLRKNLYYFASKKAFDIEGLGPKIVNQLVENNLITDPADIFSLKEGDLVPLERFATKSAGNLVKAISQRRRIPLSRFILSLGIRHVGEETAIDLANHFGSIEKIKKANQEDLEKVKDIGPIMAESIAQWFKDKQNLKLLEKFKKAGVKIIRPAEHRYQPLAEKIFVLTGELKSMTRDEAKEKIRSLGGDVSNSVSKKTDYVVVGQEPGSKYDEAKRLGIKILDESEFLKLIK